MDNDELKIKIPVLVDDDAAAKARFQKSISDMADDMTGANAPKIEITVSKINGTSAINAFKTQIEAAIGQMGKTPIKPKITVDAKAWKVPYAQKQDIPAQTYNLTPYKNFLKQKESEHEKELQREEAALIASNKRKEAELLKTKNTAATKVLVGETNRDVANAKINIDKYASLGQNVDTVSASFENLTVAKSALDVALNDKTQSVESVAAAYKDYKIALDQTKNGLSTLGAKNTAETSYKKDEAALHNLILEMQAYEKANDRLHGDSKYSAQFTDLKSRSQAAFDAGDFAKVRQLNEEMRTLRQHISAAGLEGQKFGTKLGQQFEKLGVYLSASAVIMKLGQAIKATVKTVIELDGVVVDLQIATGGTRKETQALLNTYSEMGKELGATTVDVGKAADAWLRQGYSIEQTNTLIKNSMMLSKLGQIDSAESTKALTSAMKGYKLSVEDVSGVVDKFTAIDLKAATSAGEIATAMAEVSTSARLAGVDIDKLSGYLAVVSEVSQDAPESVGTFYRTMFARMGNIKAGELIDPEDSSSLSDVESVLSGLDIKLRSSKGEFRNFGEVLDEVAAKWGNYGTVNQNAIAVAFAG